MPAILKCVAYLTGEEIEPERTDCEQPDGEERRSYDPVLQRKEHQTAEAYAHAGQHTGDKDLERPHVAPLSAASMTWLQSTAVVILPAPLGTGVMARTYGKTSSHLTSPQSLPAASKLMPTSMTI